MELRELYQEIILDHSKKPRNYHELAQPSGKAEGYNPLCGDQATVFLKVDGDTVTDASFVGKGCSIAMASASLMTEAVKGKSRAEVTKLFERFHGLITSDATAAQRDTGQDLGKLAAFAGVAEFPVRVKCAALAWHTLKSALSGEGAVVSTEKE